MSRPLAATALALTFVACVPGPMGEGPSAPAPPAKRSGPVVYENEAPLPGTKAAFALPKLGEKIGFFDAPWPSELRRQGGRPDFDGFPGEGGMLLGEYVATAKRDVEGFSIAPVIYFRFDGPLRAAALPAPAATLDARAAILLVDVDPSSPERGMLRPVEARVFGPGMKFVPTNTLAIKPLAGFVLRPGTLYAAVVKRALGDVRGAPLGAAREVEVVKNTRPRADAVEEGARAMHQGAFEQLDALGVERADVAAIAVFKTQRPTLITERLLEAASRLAGSEAPKLVRAGWMESAPHRGRATPTSYTTIRGYYCTPNFQGEIDRAPFLDGGGELSLGEGGVPKLVPVAKGSAYRNDECGPLLRARFVLSIPNSPMPAGGYPLMLSAHGTGGNAFSFLGEEDFAGWAARVGIAVVSTDQPVHGGDDPLGQRPGSREPVVFKIGGFPLPLGRGKELNELGFYNPLHPGAARDNLRQATVDGKVLLHLVAATDFASAKGSSGAPLLAAGTRPPPRFDASRLFYAGHSQGSQSAAVLGALDPAARATVLSGCGGDVRIGIVRRRDLAITAVLGTLLGTGPDELDEFHPLLSLAQTIADPIDPATYARLYWEPVAGRAPAPVLHVEGVSDTYNPKEGAEALAIALHATQVGPVVHPIPGLDLLGPRRAPNALLAQFASTRGEDGHFVVYYEPEASALVRDFLARSLGR